MPGRDNSAKGYNGILSLEVHRVSHIYTFKRTWITSIHSFTLLVYETIAICMQCGDGVPSTSQWLSKGKNEWTPKIVCMSLQNNSQYAGIGHAIINGLISCTYVYTTLSRLINYLPTMSQDFQTFGQTFYATNNLVVPQTTSMVYTNNNPYLVHDNNTGNDKAMFSHMENSYFLFYDFYNQFYSSWRWALQCSPIAFLECAIWNGAWRDTNLPLLTLSELAKANLLWQWELEMDFKTVLQHLYSKASWLGQHPPPPTFWRTILNPDTMPGTIMEVAQVPIQSPFRIISKVCCTGRLLPCVKTWIVSANPGTPNSTSANGMDDERSEKLKAFGRFRRNNRLMKQILSETVVPDPRNVVSTTRVSVLKEQVQALEKHYVSQSWFLHV